MKRIILFLSMSFMISCGSGGAKQSANPLLQSWDTPYEIAPFESIKATDYLEAYDVAFAEQRQDIERIINDTAEPSFESVIFPLDNAGLRLAELNDLFTMSEAAMSDEGYSEVSEELMPRVAASKDSVLMNESLFDKVKAVYLKRDNLELDDAQMRLTEKIYNKFVRGGANLSEGDKRKLAEINEELARLTSRFSSNLTAENGAFVLELGAKEIAGISKAVRDMAKAEAEARGLKDKWVFTLNTSSLIPFLSSAEDRELREQIYKAYIKRGANGGQTDNREVVVRFTQLRQQRAKLLGYKNHAEYIISQQMASTPEAAYELLDKIWTPALERAKEERDELQKMLEKDHPDAKLEAWDWWYYSEKVRDEKYNLNDDLVLPYFSLEAVRSGAFALANRLYGITFRPIQVPIYNDDCVTFEVVDRDNSHLGILYFDLYPRSGKWQGAWCGNLREQRTDGGERICPVVAIVCNFPRPSKDTPSLLSIDQVETLFHEFGHALHFLFQNVDYRGLSNVEGDFVEFPSQVMENWALEPELLAMYAVHYRTGRVISESIVEKIQEARHFNQGYMTTSITAAALLDLDLQTLTECDELDVESFEREALLRRGMIPEIESRYQLPNFAHLFAYDYSAGYYFYLWAEVLDKDGFAAFKESGDIFSKEFAEKLRREVLQRGGEADGMTLYKNFRGAEPSQEPMLEARGLLNSDKE